MSWFSRPRPSTDSWALDRPLYCWSKFDDWTVGDSVQGCFAFGATGSGKTSTLGTALPLVCLRAGYGALVLTVKADEADRWEQLCRTAGREADLIRFSPAGPWRFNPLEFEMRRPGTSGGAGSTHNVASLLSELAMIADRQPGGRSGGSEDGFWRQSSDRLQRNGIEVLALAGETISVPNLHRLILSAPTSLVALASREWQERSDCYRWLKQAERQSLTAIQRADLDLAATYWLAEFPVLAEKTRSIIVAGFASMADVLSRGMIRELLSTGTNVTPAMAREGKIIVIDLPIHTYAAVGAYAQLLWKRSFQMEMERTRNMGSLRPVMLFADECQFLVTPTDTTFQSTARASRVATIYITQNINSLLAAGGGSERARADVNSLLANFTTIVGFGNGCAQTAEYLSGLAGKSLQYFSTFNRTEQPADLVGMLAGFGDHQASAGMNESWSEDLRPEVFTRFRTGGARHRKLVDAAVFRLGRSFHATGKNHQITTFAQE